MHVCANSLGHNNHNMWLGLFIDIFKIILKEGIYLIRKSVYKFYL